MLKITNNPLIMFENHLNWSLWPKIHFSCDFISQKDPKNYFMVIFSTKVLVQVSFNMKRKKLGFCVVKKYEIQKICLLM